jgi:hypothetical protein
MNNAAYDQMVNEVIDAYKTSTTADEYAEKKYAWAMKWADESEGRSIVECLFQLREWDIRYNSDKEFLAIRNNKFISPYITAYGDKRITAAKRNLTQKEIKAIARFRYALMRSFEMKKN